MKRRIQCFENVDFSKLLAKGKSLKEDEQRLEIVSKNGMTFLAPISDGDLVHINSYAKWEQAFRVYSNILTTKFPGKATKLLAI